MSDWFRKFNFCGTAYTRNNELIEHPFKNKPFVPLFIMFFSFHFIRLCWRAKRCVETKHVISQLSVAKLAFFSLMAVRALQVNHLSFAKMP